MRRIILIFLLLGVGLLLSGCTATSSPLEDTLSALNAVATNLAGLIKTMTLQSWLMIGSLFFLVVFAAVVLRRQSKNAEILVNNHLTSQTAFMLYIMKKDGVDPKSLKKDLAQLHDFLLEGDKTPRKRKKRKTKHASKKRKAS